MSDLMAIVLAALPVLAFVALVVETVRAATGAAAYPPVDLRYRAYGA